MKRIFIIFIFLFILTFLGCRADNPKYISLKEKPNNNYYTCSIGKLLLDKNDYTLKLYSTNLCKTTELNEEEKKILINFINSTKPEDYLDSSKDDIIAENIAPYELIINFNNKEKYIIKIFSPALCSVNPWDGSYNEDFIKTDTVEKRYNLYEFCNYIERRNYNNYKDTFNW